MRVRKYISRFIEHLRLQQYSRRDSSVENKITRTEYISVEVMRMLCQLVRFGSVKRANVKFTKMYVVELNSAMRLFVNHQDIPGHLLSEEKKG